MWFLDIKAVDRDGDILGGEVDGALSGRKEHESASWGFVMTWLDIPLCVMMWWCGQRLTQPAVLNLKGLKHGSEHRDHF